MKLFFLIQITWFFLSTGLFAQPVDYYKTADGLTGTALQQALHDIIDNHSVSTYTDLWSYVQRSDKKGDGTVWDIYTDIPGGSPVYTFQSITDQCGNYSAEGDCYNREHSFPKSWFGGEIQPMYTDLFHIYPTDGYVNNRRGNFPYGETDSPTWTSSNGSKVGNSSVSGFTGTIFEPIDEYKGDLARTYFYMATRYLGEDSSWPGSAMVDGAQPMLWAIEMLLQWHINDPVSQKELTRNDSVYKIQSNRNPFIDNPDYAFAIWDNSASIAGSTDYLENLLIYPDPATDYIYFRISQEISAELKLEIINSTGVKVLTDNFDSDTENLIDISNLPAGLYYLSVYYGKTFYCTRFIIIR